ncbi:MAG: DNA-3-methyladenine glycosylase, partial [Cytophagales bacterium]
MKHLNPHPNGTMRSMTRLCAGQTLLCASLALKVKDWNKKPFDENQFYLGCIGYHPKHIIQTTRLGIAQARDAHLPYRFIDAKYVDFCTQRPKAYTVSNKSG